MKERFQIFYKLRGPLMAPPYLFIVFAFLYETEWEATAWTVGMIVFAAGVFVRVWAQMHLHYRLKIKKQLTTTGPYVYVRNPIYIGNTTMLLGLTIVSGMPWFLPIMLVWCAVVYAFVVRREEHHLLNKYGEPYAEFLRTVPRWLPHTPATRGPQPEVRQHFWASIVAELHCLLFLIPLIGKQVWETLG